MNFFKRALKYCWRQRLCSVLLLLTFTLLSATVLIAISSEKAVQQGTKQIKETVGASVRIELDTSNQANYGSAEDFGNGAYGYIYNGDFITQEIVDKIAELPNVVSYNAKDSEGYPDRKYMDCNTIYVCVNGIIFWTCQSNRFIHCQQIGRKYIQIDRSDCHIRYA